MTDAGVGQSQDVFAAIVRGRQSGEQTADLLRWIGQLVWVVFRIVTWVLSIPAEVLLHHSFGVRYLSVVTLVTSLVVYAAGGFVLGGFKDAGVAIYACVCVCGLVGAYRVWRAMADERAGVVRHSRSAGLPYRVWARVPKGGNAAFVMRCYEPLLVVAVGALVALLSLWPGMFIAACGVSVFTKHTLDAWKLRAEVLDQVDRQIESEVIAELVETRRTPEPSRGYVVPAGVERLFTGASPDAEDVRQRMVNHANGVDAHRRGVVG